MPDLTDIAAFLREQEKYDNQMPDEVYAPDGKANPFVGVDDLEEIEGLDLEDQLNLLLDKGDREDHEKYCRAKN